MLPSKSNFSAKRRQKLLGQTGMEAFDRELIAYEEAKQKLLLREDLRAEGAQSARWTIGSNRLERLILHYTAGEAVEDLVERLPPVVTALNEFSLHEKRKPGHAAAFEITQVEAYVYMFWILGLSTLLGHRELVPVVLGWVNKDPEFNRGRDGLFEFVVEKLTGSRYEVDRVLLHPDPYLSLAKATVVPPEERPLQVAAFLQDWYKGMDDCYWHGAHTEKGSQSAFFGYWSFEAALVTYLWDIDDSSYRDHQFYPKDLVDYARQNFPYSSTIENSTVGLRCDAGQPCPKEGWWFTPAEENSRRYFKLGEVMPSVGGDYGATIWQWDGD